MKEILDLIEADEPQLSLIEQRLWCWLNNREFVEKHDFDWKRGCQDRVYWTGSGYVDRDGIKRPFHEGDWVDVPNYTGSRDIIKTLRPFNCHSYAINVGDGDTDEFWGYCNPVQWDAIRSPEKPLPSEELAELRAVIQAIEIDRNNAWGGGSDAS